MNGERAVAAAIHAGLQSAEVTDMRELAEAMARDVYRKEQGNG